MPLGCVGRETNCTTPPNASLPYKLDPPSCEISTSEIDSAGTRSQYTHPPKGSFSGMPSSSTSARLAPLAPNPRRETPCVVGFAVRLLDRRYKLNPGTWRRSSSSRSAGVSCKSSRARPPPGLLPFLKPLRAHQNRARHPRNTLKRKRPAGIAHCRCQKRPRVHLDLRTRHRRPARISHQAFHRRADARDLRAAPGRRQQYQRDKTHRTRDARLHVPPRPESPEQCRPASMRVHAASSARIISQPLNRQSSKNAPCAEVQPAPRVCYRVLQFVLLDSRRDWHGYGGSASQ